MVVHPFFIISSTNNLGSDVNVSSINFDSDLILKPGLWFIMKLLWCSFGCIKIVIKINVITIGIRWHTSYTTFFYNSVYSSESYSSVERDLI